MWSHTKYQEDFRRDHHQHFKFHLVCYNILAQKLLEDNPFLYGNCLRNNLKWYRRKDRLLRELLRQDADVCLSERSFERQMFYYFRFYVYKKCKMIIMKMNFDQD